MNFATSTNFRFHLIILTAVLISSFLFGCSRFANNSSSTDSAKSETVTSATPPFKTKEPERYRATRVITSTVTPTNTGQTFTHASSSIIARDGNNRYEEHETLASGRVGYLHNANGTFVLLPALKLFAIVPVDEAPKEIATKDEEVSSGVTELLDQSETESTYERLGYETLGERHPAKYRINHVTNPASAQRESFVWFDEELGLVIRSETSYVDSYRSTKLVNELRDITVNVEGNLFQLPPDFKKVEFDAIVERLVPNESKQQ